MGCLRVAYSGIKGAFAYIAASKIFPDENLVPCANFKEAYDKVAEGQCDYAVLPIENSYAGEVGQVTDLMFNGNLFVNGVYSLKVTQNLLTVPGTKAEDIKKVISHPQALEQCAEYITAHGYEIEESTNTARAAKYVADLGDKSVAAIASIETAKLYGLDVFAKNINKSEINTTRFAVFTLTEEELKESDDEYGTFLMMFTVKNEAGSLAKAITMIGNNGYNLRVLRSRPLRTLAWQYYFYVEAEGKVLSESGAKMISELKQHCDMLKILGHYAIDEDLS